jgi:hypothetical protein
MRPEQLDTEKPSGIQLNSLSDIYRRAGKSFSFQTMKMPLRETGGGMAVPALTVITVLTVVA